MIRPPGWDGVAFSEQADGDMRNDTEARSSFSLKAGIPSGWATVRQVHGSSVVRVEDPGSAGEADAVWTTAKALPIAVFTADCFGVVVVAEGAVGVAHAGWRGLESGVIGSLRTEMAISGFEPHLAAVGAGIGPCCFEVGEEVASQFDNRASQTTWGTLSVDLPAVLSSQLQGLTEWRINRCTLHDEGSFSHRRDKTSRRMAAVGWRL